MIMMIGCDVTDDKDDVINGCLNKMMCIIININKNGKEKKSTK